MKRSVATFVVLGLLLLILVPSCGGGKTPAASNNKEPTPTPTKSVKIGVIMPWSGPVAMSGQMVDQIIAVVEHQIKDMGGILGGREVEFVRGDDRGVLAESVSQARKLSLDNKVAILTCGGISGAHYTAVAAIADEIKVPFLSLGTIYDIQSMKYCACLYSTEPLIARVANFLIDVVKPKRVAWLAYDNEDSHGMIDGVKGISGFRERIKSEGIDIVYEEYFPIDATDFSSYLTKIKYVNPDILISFTSEVGQAVTICKQIGELGGWGGMKYFNSTETGTAKSVMKLPGSVGTYTAALWLPGSADPGMKSFEDVYVQYYGREPAPELSYFYNCFWTAIKAIELAGTTDHDKVAEAMRSGNLVWDSAWGSLRIAADGIGEMNGMVAQIQEGGKLVKVWPQ